MIVSKLNERVIMYVRKYLIANIMNAHMQTPARAVTQWKYLNRGRKLGSFTNASTKQLKFTDPYLGVYGCIGGYIRVFGEMLNKRQ